jgi:hypothetical protein
MFYVLLGVLIVSAIGFGVMGKFPPSAFSEVKRYSVAGACLIVAAGALALILLRHNPT